MTIIAAIYDFKTQTAWYGSDTAAVNGGYQYICGPKFSKCGDWMVGVAGDARLETLIRLHASAIGDSESPMVLADKIRRRALDDEFKPGEETGAKYFPGSSLVIVGKGAVHVVCSAFSVDKIQPDSLCAEGSGRDYALGADYAVRDRPAPKRLKIALEAAITLNSACGGEAWIAKL